MQPGAEPEDDLPKLTRKSPFTITAKLCPRCLKPLQRGSKFGGWLVPQDYVCPSCGYRGTVFLEKDLDLNPDKKGES